MPRLFLISPLPAVRAGLRALLGGAGEFEIAGELPSLEALAATDAGETGETDVVVLDAAPGADAADLAVAGASGTAGGPGLVLLGPVAGEDRLPAYLAGQPWAYLPREARADQLLAAVRAVANGLVVIDPALAGHVMVAAAGDTVAPATAGEDLTPREREVLTQLALGLPNKTIARRLSISEHTAKFHVAAVMAKLGASSRTEAVRLGARRGLVAL